MSCEAEKKAMNRELSSHLSELRIEGTSISAVDFSDPCFACGNKKRRCRQPPTTFRKKVLIVEDDDDSDPKSSPCSDADGEPGVDFPVDIKIQEEVRKEQSSGGCGGGGECSLCRHCSCKSNSSDASGLGLVRSSSLVTAENGGGYGGGSSPSGGLCRTTSVLTEEKGLIISGGGGDGSSPFLGKPESNSFNGGRLPVTPIPGRSPSLSGGSSLSPSGDGAHKDDAPDGTPAASHDLLVRNESVSSLITPPPFRSSSVVHFASPDAKTPHCRTDDPSPVVVDGKNNPNNDDRDDDNDDVVTRTTTVSIASYEPTKKTTATTLSSGGRSAEKVKVSLRCQCGARHKIIF